jgi:hypothetical protein
MNKIVIAAVVALLLSFEVIGAVPARPPGPMEARHAAAQPTAAPSVPAATATASDDDVPPPETQAAIRDALWGYSGYVLVITVVVLAGIIGLHRARRTQSER